MEPARRGRGGIGNGIVARGRTFGPQSFFDMGFNGVQAHILPAILYLNVGESESLLKSSSHLRRVELVCRHVELSARYACLPVPLRHELGVRPW